MHRKAPPLPALPPELHGRPIVTVICCYAGPVEDGERVVRPLKAFGSPLLDLCTRKPFVEHQAMFDASFPEGWWYYFRSCDVATLTDEVIDITADHAQRIRSPLTAFPIFHLGGAVGRVGDDETAFNGRAAGHTFNINATTATRRRVRGGARVVAQLLVGPPALPHRRLRQLPDGRGPAAGPRRLRPREVRAAAES